MALSLDPNKEQARDGLNAIDLRRTQLIDYYTSEATKQTQAKPYSRAIELWQEVLVLDPSNTAAEQAIADLQKQRTAAAKPPSQPTKPKKNESALKYGTRVPDSSLAICLKFLNQTIPPKKRGLA